MKPVFTLFAVILLFVSCKKEVREKSGSDVLQVIKESLADSVNKSDYEALDFKRAVSNKIDTAGLYIIRVPFKGKSIAELFLIIKMKLNGSIEGGKIIQLNGGVRDVGEDPVKQWEWEGSISISSLNRKSIIQSAIHKGYIEAFHKTINAREETKEPDPMPEVVIVTYVNRTVDYSTFLWLDGFFYTGGSYGDRGSGTGGYYGSIDGGGGYSGGGGSYIYTGDGGSTPTTDETMFIDMDTYVDHPAIDVDAFLKCFSSIPDQGAVCSIEIFTDIPVDSDPTKLFNWQTESPGHTFLQLKKTSADGSQSIVQNIGFYPQARWKNILNADPVNSKMVDDGNHEFNASLFMDLNAFSFSSVLGKIKELSTMSYDIDEFNCTDFALEVFNYVRNPLSIPRYPIPGTIGTVASNTPQGLYSKLREMLNSNDSEAGNIKFPGVKGWVSGSAGPCN